MKKLLFIYLFSLSNAFAACLEPEEKHYALFDMVVIADHPHLRDELVNTYCFNHPKFYQNIKPTGRPYMGVFKSRYIEDLLIFFPPGSSINSFGEDTYFRDLLSFLSTPYHTPNIDPVKGKLIEEYFKITNFSKNFYPLHPIAYHKMIDFIISKYNLEKFTFIDKDDLNNNLHYLILVNQPQFIHDFIITQDYRHEFLFKKNRNGFTPLHLLFSKKFPYYDFNQELAQETINNMLLPIIEKNLLKLAYQNDGVPFISFIDFAYIMQEKNPHLWKKISSYFHHATYFHNPISTEQRLVLQKTIANQMTMRKLLDSYDPSE